MRAGKKLSEAERLAILGRTSAALMSEQDEGRLLRLIAQAAVDLTGAEFAAFTLRPVDEQGRLLVPAEGNLFHLAAVIGVTKEQEALFRRMPLGGEGLLAPIFRYKALVRIADVYDMTKSVHEGSAGHVEAREAAFTFTHGQMVPEELRSIGLPHGHPSIRSFLGAPLLDHDQEVRGGLLLGHSQPDQFSEVDEVTLQGLAAQAAVAVENARLYKSLWMRVQELQAIFESIDDGVTLVDPQGKIMRENEKAQKLRQQLIASPQGKQNFEALVHAPARQALQGIIKPALSISIGDEQLERREYVVRASSLQQPSSQPLHEGQNLRVEVASEAHVISGAVVVWHDVTESRKSQLERQTRVETEARLSLLQGILDELPTSVYLVYGRDARLFIANKATNAVWGAVWEQGRPMRDFLQEKRIQIFRVDGLPLPLEQLATLRAVQQGETISSQQETIRHFDGTALPVLVNAIALDTERLSIRLPEAFSPSARPEPMALVVHQDVSALKEAEKMKDDFIGIAAHELRNPLAALYGFVRLLLIQSTKGKGSELAAWQQESLQGIEQSTTRLVSLTDDLLDVTRLQAGCLELRQEAVDLIALMKRVIGRMQTNLEKHRLILSSQADFLVCWLDVQRVEQVMANLLTNAVKYSPQGGVVEVRLWEEKEASRALVSIKDSGIGIPVMQQARIFGRFVRAENGQALGIQGTGLGLYLSRGFVESHGGHLWFQSTEGVGSTFLVSFPTLPIEEVQDAMA